MDLGSVMVLPAGAVFRAVDLHVHTPASADVGLSYGDAEPDDIVRVSLDRGLDGIGITDHNSTAWCERVIDAARDTPLVVFPGVEISTSEGHLLAIFDPGARIDSIDELLVRLGLSGERYGDVEALASGRFDDVAKQVREAGGLAIAAHLTAKKGFWARAEGVRRQEIHREPAVEAYELNDVTLREDLEGGRLSGYDRHVACVQGSDSWLPGDDSHTLDGIGSRRTILKVETLTLNALRHAFADFEMRVRLEGDPLSVPDMVIEAAWFEGGFLDGEAIRCNDDMTCLIGGTGTGKSLVVEVLRFLLDQQASPRDFPAIHKEVVDRLAFALRPDATAHAVLRRDNVRYLVSRGWLDEGPADPVVYEYVNGSPHPFTDVSPRDLFPIRAFSQSEVIEYARQPLARLSLIDELLELRPERQREDRLLERLGGNALELQHVDDQIAVTREAVEGSEALRERIKALASFFETAEVKVQAQWEAEKAYLDAAKQYVDDLLQNVGTTQPADAPAAPTERANPEVITNVTAIVDSGHRAVRDRQAAIRQELEGVVEALDKVYRRWHLDYEKHERRVRELQAKVEPSGATSRASLRTQLQRLQQQEAGLARQHEDLTKKLLPNRVQLLADRDNLLTDLQETRTAIREKRATKAQELNDRMGGTVRISVERWAQRDGYVQALLDLRTGSRISENDVRRISQHCHPVPFVKSLQSGEFNEPAARAGLDPGVLERFRDNLTERGRIAELHDLQVTNLEDRINIQFALDDQSYRGLESLAHGQKCTAVLVVVMAEGDSPLLVDQPEDALHAPWIEKYLVERLRSSRGRRQYVFATRSPNIVVSADADQIVALAATSDAGHVEKTGGLESFDTAELVLYHVEGGRDPFIRRSGKYGLP